MLIKLSYNKLLKNATLIYTSPKGLEACLLASWLHLLVILRTTEVAAWTL